MRTFAIVNRKGGVGKTTTAVELAFILATSCKQRVLFIDADSQGNATSMMLASGQDPSGAGLAAALEYPIEYYPDIIWRTDYEGLDIIPAGEDLADYELSRLLLGEKPNFDRMRRLMEASLSPPGSTPIPPRGWLGWSGRSTTSARPAPRSGWPGCW